VKRLGQALLLLIVVAALVYSWGNRAGRYQVERLDTSLFIVLDTSNGKHWIYRPSVEYRGDQAHVHFTVEDREEAVALWRRFLPY